MHEEIKSILNLGNTGCHMIQNLLCSCCVLSKSIDIKELTCESIILPVSLCAYQTLYLNLSKEHRLRVFKNRMPRKMCGSKRKEVARGWRKALNKERFDLYSSQKISRVMKLRMMRWVCYGAHGREERCMQGFGGET
jgi:hypothetical protein